jgi:hypothetical protein
MNVAIIHYQHAGAALLNGEIVRIYETSSFMIGHPPTPAREGRAITKVSLTKKLTGLPNVRLPTFLPAP